MSDREWDPDDPQVIKAKADAEVREAEARVKVLEARANLHPIAQAVDTFFESLSNLVGVIGCLGLIGLVILVFFGQPIIQAIARLITK